MEFLFGKTFDLLSTALNFRAERHKVIASNIANIDTQNYKPQELSFQKDLENVILEKKELELMRTQSKHLSVQGEMSNHFLLRQFGDKVEIDKEMTNLAENNLMYNFTVELIVRKFRGINTALKETK